MNLNALITGLLICVITSCSVELPEDVSIEYDKLPQELDFNIHVKPILSDKCFVCHGPDKAKQQAELRLDLAASAYSDLVNSPGKQAVVPGKLAKSEMFHRIISHDPEVLMPTPKSNLKLSAHEKAVLVKWIEDGAEYKPHWAFIKPEKRDVPVISNADWVINPIDNFIVNKLEQEKLQPSPQTDKELLLRRVAFDLTGLPPSVEDIQAFLSDDSDYAYENQVDRLLDSPQYGEKMAMDWMDLSRFADTHGYTVDRYRDMSPWRDWVIKAFNENMSYDKFIEWQLAGDLLPNPSKDQILATAFNRIHPQNMEGGIVPEEFRVEYVLDRVNTAGQAFMALTVACAKCHDHKYDPISQKNYFEMSAFFNNVEESGQISWDNAMPVPTMLYTTEEQEEVLDFLKSTTQAKASDLESIQTSEKESFKNWIANEKYKENTKSIYPKGLIAHFEFENAELKNRLDVSQKGGMKRVGSSSEEPEFGAGKTGQGLVLDGDNWFDSHGVGAFRKSEPFSVSLNVTIPKNLENGVIFHKSEGAALYCFRGFHLALENNKLELLMAHTAPGNAIIEYSKLGIPRDQWINLMLTYDGSAKASGLKVYLNGVELETEVKNDNLYKDIHFGRKVEPGIQIGARMRGKGIGGATVDDLLVFEQELTPLEVIQVVDHSKFKEILSKSQVDLAEAELAMLKPYFFLNYSKVYKKLLNDLEMARMTFSDSVESIQEIMVMDEMPERRKTYLLERGNYDAHGEEVFPNTPESVFVMPEDLPRNRLGFAKWLVHTEHPLTARVAVNRYWQNFFGRGIVRTTEDFGNQGELPSHPELLDWLAVEFMESGWDVKALQKLMVMSATYRQSSKTSNELREFDKENILLARGPAVRLTAEMIRDNALMTSGLLNTKIGGESVKPYQPAGLWKVNGNTYDQDTGDKLYRRSMYTIWKRSVPHPTLATFDSPSRSECTVRRQKTNTPLQALVLLNDPTFVEASKVIGEKITRFDSIREGISETFMKLTGRKPNDRELEVLLELQEKQYAEFKEHKGKAKGWLASGEYELDVKLDANLIAANAVVASAIMNSDATITKR